MSQRELAKLLEVSRWTIQQVDWVAVGWRVGRKLQPLNGASPVGSLTQFIPGERTHLSETKRANFRKRDYQGPKTVKLETGVEECFA